MPSRPESVNSSEMDCASRVGVPSHTLSDTIRERDRLRHDLKKTNIKPPTSDQDAASIYIQNSVFLDRIRCFQTELRAVKAERKSLETIVTEKSCALSSVMKHSECLYTVSNVSLRYLGVGTKVLSKRSACCTKKTLELCPSSTIRLRR